MPDSSGFPRRCLAGVAVVSLAAEEAQRLDAPGGLEELAGVFSRSGARVIDHCSPLGLLRIEVASGEDLPSACARLGALSGVRRVEPDWVGEGGDVPSDPLFPSQWHLQQASDHDIDAPEAWQITEGSEAVVVAILDTGILPDHPEFAGRVLPGKNFVNPLRPDDTTADHPHGVYTAGLLAANARNGFQVAGVDHRCKILPVKVLDQDNLGTDWALIQGLVFAADQGARVISMSLINFGESDALKEAVRYAREGGRERKRGVVLVACSGNGGLLDADRSWPGASSLCITVGATGDDDRRASFSGTGLALDVVAPGRDLLTVSPDRDPGAVAHFTGCSAATPVAAGIAALLLAADPSLTPEEVQELIQRGAQDQVGGTEDLPGWDPFYGWGRVNARGSLDLLGTRFLRGNANPDLTLDISDPLYVLGTLFQGGRPFLCLDAADANDDGSVDIADATAVLNFLFLSGQLPWPFPACGLDVTPDPLDCARGCP